MKNILLGISLFLASPAMAGVQAITSAGTIADGSINTAKLAADAVIGTKILDGTIDTAKLNATIQQQLQNVGTVGAGSIDTTKLATDSVIGSKILTGTIDTGKLNATLQARVGGNYANTNLSATYVEASSITITGVTTGVGKAFGVTNGTFTVLNNGRVGVGVANPQVALDVSRGANDGGVIFRISNNDSSATAYDFSRDNGTGFLEIQGNQVGANTISLAPTSGDVLIGTMTIKGATRGLPQSQALCVTTSQILGYCSTVVGASGGCTCVAP